MGAAGGGDWVGRVVREQIELGRNLDGDRPGRARAREVEGPADGRVDVRCAIGPEHGLRHRAQNRGLIDVVQLVGAARVPADARGDHHHRMPSSSASATPDRQCVTPAPGTTFTTPTESDERTPRRP